MATSTPYPIVDTHCHLDYIARSTDHPEGEEGTAPDKVLGRARLEGVDFLVNPCVEPGKYDEVIALAERFENVYAAIAIHPTDVNTTEQFPAWQDRVMRLLDHPKVVAIGETGLDYYWDTSLKELQQECFRWFLQTGVERNLPVIVHDRDAHDDIQAIISEFPQARGIMHCFSGDADFARTMTLKNFYISFAGNVTFKNARNLHEAAAATPLERILVETDSPFLSPMPHRGKPNEPARVRFVVEKIAELKGISYEEVARVTTQNARNVFGIAG